MHTERKRERTAVIGALVGNSLEWFDFFVYGTASALVFSTVFFPEVDAATGLLASFATMWVGFLARPIGGWLFGHLGDKHGRKNVLMLTLVMMGAATVGIGLLPTYAQVGILAPTLLVILRAIQGLSVGGEWGGAVLIATENAREERKTIAGAWVQQASPIGSLMATGSFVLVGMLPDEAFFSWGWRVPFWFSIVLVIVGIVLRMRVQESEEFVKTKQSGKLPQKAPALLVFQKVPLLLFFGVLASIIAISNAYFTNTFFLAWATGPLGFDRQLILNILVGATVVQFFTQLAGGYLAQRFGRTRIMMVGLSIALVGTVPYFWAISLGNLVFISAMVYLTFGAVCMYFAVLSSFLAYAFPANVRYSGLSLAYQLCSSLIGGSTAFIAQWILTSSGNDPWAVAWFYAAMVAATIVGVIGVHRYIQHKPVDNDTTAFAVAGREHDEAKAEDRREQVESGNIA